MREVTGGDANVGIGRDAGYNTTEGEYNISMGYQSKPSAVDTDNEITIGKALTGKGAGTGYYGGNSAIYSETNGTAWNQVSDQRIKKNIEDNNTGLDVIKKVKIRNFEYRLPEEIEELPKSDAVDKEGIQVGTIAQELEEIAPEMIITHENGRKSVKPDNFTWYLINAVQELSAEVEQLKSKAHDKCDNNGE